MTESERRYETIVRLGGAICGQSFKYRHRPPSATEQCPEVLTFNNTDHNLYCPHHGLVSTLGCRARMDDIDIDDADAIRKLCNALIEPTE